LPLCINSVATCTNTLQRKLQSCLSFFLLLFSLATFTCSSLWKCTQITAMSRVPFHYGFLPMCLRLGQAFYLTNLLLPSESSSPPASPLSIVSWALRAASFLPLSLRFPCVDIAPPTTPCSPTPTTTPSPPFHFTFGRCRLLLFLLPVAVAVYRLSLPVRNGKGSTLMGRGVGVDREGVRLACRQQMHFIQNLQGKY